MRERERERERERGRERGREKEGEKEGGTERERKREGERGRERDRERQREIYSLLKYVNLILNDSICLSTRSTRLIIRLSTSSTRTTICRSFYN